MFGTVFDNLKFSAAHRIEGHYQYGRLHGHNYVVTVALIQNQSVITMDYEKVRMHFQDWLNDYFDHRYLVSQENVTAGCLYYKAVKDEFLYMDDLTVLDIPKSTPEYLAEYLYHMFAKILGILEGFACSIVTVSVRESDTCVATYTHINGEGKTYVE